MIEIQNTIISRDLVEEQFVCDLSACKGACCVEGDFGAPLLKGEVEAIQENLSGIKKHMSDFGLEVLDQDGFFELDPTEEEVTTTYKGKECLFSKYDANGILKCAVEEAHKAGDSDFLKPVSCHLYPVRVQQHRVGLGVNYDKWDICKAACDNGKRLKVPVFEFVKVALVRRFGQEWWDELKAVANYMRDNKDA